MFTRVFPRRVFHAVERTEGQRVGWQRLDTKEHVGATTDGSSSLFLTLERRKHQVPTTGWLLAFAIENIILKQTKQKKILFSILEKRNLRHRRHT